jgi:hypothetical protein
LTVLDTRLLIYRETEPELEHKANLVSLALSGLLLGVTATAVAAGLSLKGASSIDDHERPQHGCVRPAQAEPSLTREVRLT